MDFYTKPELYSAIAAAISALCAAVTLYLIRSEGKGFIWAKDQKANILHNTEGQVIINIEIPLHNLGKGVIKFISLRCKKINLENNAVENYDTDMDEAYFPANTHILTYQTNIYNDVPKGSEKTLIFQPIDNNDITLAEKKKLQKNIQTKVNSLPEHIVVMKCLYKDGSWFGFKTRETIIGLLVDSQGLHYLSVKRRKELDDFFKF